MTAHPVPLAVADEEPSAETLQTWVRAALIAAGHPPAAEVGVRIVGEAEMAELNHRFRHREGPTNSLAFEAGEGPDGAAPFLGDIALCGEVIRREAERWQIPPQERWAHLCIHATLHLLGHDHDEPESAHRMERIESRAMHSLGLADPWK